ncbi:hypothetical protein VN97_g9372 [Penicillium thymicola]|uniref:Uncharacterized protein n=1 Tax=Penicillium thymicola TaxID=293382 RepID=A0AAI9X4U8_PENTH|nr:hypothetical protein VN97_g9372 [Penicillium thymicola]
MDKALPKNSMDIPQISKQPLPEPKRFPHCCLSISSSLITYLASLLPKKPTFTVSLGSRSGLLGHGPANMAPRRG